MPYPATGPQTQTKSVSLRCSVTLFSAQIPSKAFPGGLSRLMLMRATRSFLGADAFLQVDQRLSAIIVTDPSLNNPPRFCLREDYADTDHFCCGD